MAQDFSGITWPGWNIAGILGHGSYGKVYAIERDVFGHTEKAALKVISIPQNDGEIEELYNDGYDSESITQRFKSYLQDIVREYSLMSEMKGHSNIVYCDDLRYVQHDDGMGWDIYIKMELLTPLPKILKNGFSEKLVIKLGLDICNALILCKSKNIVHRDIKPQNIFVSEDKNFKLGDFGIAKTAERTTSGTKTGTYKYMAPEVYNNQPYGHAADIYSLGMVLYWLLNERRTPFLPLPPKIPTATDEDRARDSRFAGLPIPEPANGSDALKRIVLKACAFSPEDRYKNAAEMRNDLLTLARNGRFTAQNPRMTSQMREPVPYTDETVGNFGRAQKEKTPSEETVGVFSHNAAGGNKRTNRSESVINNINPASRKKKWIAIAVAIVATLALITTGVSIGKRSLNRETVDIETTLNATVASDYNHPDELIGKWYVLFGINDIISDSDWAVHEEYMVISQQNVVYKGMEDYPLEWTADETTLHIPAMDDKFEILDVDGIRFLRGKTMNLISENDLQNRTGKLFREVNITEDNLFDYFELCTGTVESKDEFGELTGDYERSIYLRPKTQDGYTYWVNTLDEYLDIEIEVPEHDYRIRQPHLNSKGTICSENRKLEFISNYPYKVTELISGTNQQIIEHNLNIDSNFAVLRAVGKIYFVNEKLIKNWSVASESPGYRDYLVAEDIFGMMSHFGEYVKGIAPNTTESSIYDINIAEFGNPNDVSLPAQEADHDCPGRLAIFSIDNATKIKLFCVTNMDYEKTIDAIPLTILPQQGQQSEEQQPVVTAENQMVWQIEEGGSRQIAFNLMGMYKYIAMNIVSEAADSDLQVNIYIDDVLETSDTMNDSKLAWTAPGAKKLEIVFQNNGPATKVAIQGCVSLFMERSVKSGLYGEGTETAPYCIFSVEDFIKIQDNLDAHFVLMQDLEFSPETVFRPMGDGGYRYPNWSSKGGFSGVLDGNGHKISGVRIVSPKQCGGLFTSIDETGIVKNLVLDCEISSEVVDMDNALGGITGYNNGMIQNCTVNAVGGTEGIYCMIGCIAGANHGEIKGCKTTGKLSAYGNYAKAGGIVGIQIANARSPLADCDTEAIRAYSGKTMPLAGYTQS